MAGVTIVESPKHGKISMTGGHTFNYVAGRDLGEDIFTYARQGLDTRNNPVTWTVRTLVTIVP